jgi:hypothetical protein
MLAGAVGFLRSDTKQPTLPHDALDLEVDPPLL